jgi:predicted enzyme related to lactoylglutathione lyase
MRSGAAFAIDSAVWKVRRSRLTQRQPWRLIRRRACAVRRTRLIRRRARIREEDVPLRSHSPVVHLELHTANLERACAFYSKLVGWRPERIVAGGGSYLALELGGGLGGGVVECGTERPVWLPYVSVPAVADATERAQRLGAAVLLEPREGPAGWRSVVAAPDAGEIALWQSKPTADELRPRARS